MAITAALDTASLPSNCPLSHTVCTDSFGGGVVKTVKCPFCDHELTATELTDGWCECGKKIPVFVLVRVASRGGDPPNPTGDSPHSESPPRSDHSQPGAVQPPPPVSRWGSRRMLVAGVLLAACCLASATIGLRISDSDRRSRDACRAELARNNVTATATVTDVDHEFNERTTTYVLNYRYTVGGTEYRGRATLVFELLSPREQVARSLTRSPVPGESDVDRERLRRISEEQDKRLRGKLFTRGEALTVVAHPSRPGVHSVRARGEEHPGNDASTSASSNWSGSLFLVALFSGLFGVAFLGAWLDSVPFIRRLRKDDTLGRQH